MIIERLIQARQPGTQPDMDVEREWDAVESRAGFPPKKILRSVAGGLDYLSIVIEREWDSMAAMEAAYARVADDPQWQALVSEAHRYIQTFRREIYEPLG